MSHNWLSSSSTFWDLVQDVDIFVELTFWVVCRPTTTSLSSICFSSLLPRLLLLSTELLPSESGWNVTEQTGLTSEDGIFLVSCLQKHFNVQLSIIKQTLDRVWGVVHKWPRNFGQFLTPLPHRHTFYYWGLNFGQFLNPLCPIVSQSLTSLSETVTSFMDEPLSKIKMFRKEWIKGMFILIKLSITREKEGNHDDFTLSHNGNGRNQSWLQKSVSIEETYFLTKPFSSHSHKSKIRAHD